VGIADDDTVHLTLTVDENRDSTPSVARQFRQGSREGSGDEVGARNPAGGEGPESPVLVRFQSFGVPLYVLQVRLLVVI